MVKMFIATPCGHSTVSSHYAATLFNLGRMLVRRGVESEISVVSASDIVLVRNQFVSTVLGDRSYTHLFFLDSDMSFEAGLVLRMLDFNEDFVSVAYPKRDLDLQRLLADVTPADTADASGWITSSPAICNIMFVPCAKGRNSSLKCAPVLPKSPAPEWAYAYSRCEYSRR